MNSPIEKLVRIQSEVASGDVEAFFESSVEVNGVTFRQPWESVKWNAGATPITVGDKTMTYGEVMQFVVAIAAQERAAALAAKAQPSN